MDGIVLSRRDFREADQIISLYTLEQGKVEYIARGVKKIVSKNAANLLPCSFVRVGVALGKEIDYITTVNILEYFSTLRRNFEASWQGWFFVETLHTLTAKGEKDERIFVLILNYLELLNSVVVEEIFLDIVFLRLFHFLGFTPELLACVNCSAAASSSLPFVFHVPSGGLVCLDCFSAESRSKGEGVPVSLAQISALHGFLSAKRLASFSGSVEKELAISLHPLIYDFVSYYSEKKIPDWRSARGILAE